MTTEWISLKEAADLLDVEYKTVWRLARGGELPSARVGRMYRIRRSDIDAFLEGQLAGPAAGVSDEDERLICGNCSRVIPSIDASGGPCDRDSCDELLCAVCWNQGVRFCRSHRPSSQEQIAKAQERLAQGQVDRVVTALQARQREQSFLSRFEERVYGIAALQHPLGDELLQVKDWQDFHSSGDESARLLEILSVAFLERSLLAVTPVNACSRFTMPAGSLGRNRPRQGLVMEAQCQSDLAAQARQGFVTAPTGLATLMDYLHHRQEQAERNNMLYVVGLAATSGWDRESIEYIAASPSGRSYRHRLLLPVLVDLHTTQLHYDTTDERLQGFVGLFNLARDAEDALRIKQWIEGTIVSEHRTGLPIDEVSERLGLSQNYVKQLFRQLAEDRRYRYSDRDGATLLVNNSLSL